MSSFPGSPRLLKGAIVAIPTGIPIPSVIVFQYNPDTLTRRLQPSAAGNESAPGEALRLKGPPQETINLSMEIDATDQMDRGDPMTAALGIHPALAQLELLLYPGSPVMIANEVLATLGLLEIVPPEAPLTLFVWGPSRVVPVRITDLSVEEEAYDPFLNPIRAKVTVGMRVLTYQDLGMTTAGGALFLAHQIAKEVLGAVGGVAGAIGGAASFSASASFNLSV
ncbi:MAG TPA: hypothetical protein VEQ60_20320 [Longimicrobium sp.]|nr:hypothetical protein [Longimicrobium sp.]